MDKEKRKKKTVTSPHSQDPELQAKLADENNTKRSAIPAVTRSYILDHFATSPDVAQKWLRLPSIAMHII
jgi:hypothetical protein